MVQIQTKEKKNIPPSSTLWPFWSVDIVGRKGQSVPFVIVRWTGRVVDRPARAKTWMNLMRSSQFPVPSNFRFQDVRISPDITFKDLTCTPSTEYPPMI